MALKLRDFGIGRLWCWTDDLEVGDRGASLYIYSAKSLRNSNFQDWQAFSHAYDS